MRAEKAFPRPIQRALRTFVNTARAHESPAGARTRRTGLPPERVASSRAEAAMRANEPLVASCAAICAAVCAASCAAAMGCAVAAGAMKPSDPCEEAATGDHRRLRGLLGRTAFPSGPVDWGMATGDHRRLRGLLGRAAFPSGLVDWGMATTRIGRKSAAARDAGAWFLGCQKRNAPRSHGDPASVVNLPEP